MINKLQFIHQNTVFADREAAKAYLKELIINTRPSLYAEPLVVKYESGDDAKGPNILLAIGSVGDGNYDVEYNRTQQRLFFIDIAYCEEEIEAIWERIEEIVKMLTVIPLESDTISLHTSVTSEGTEISGDVRVADAQVIHGVSRPNQINVVPDDGLYHFVDVSYSDNGVLTFQVNDEVKDMSIPVLTGGTYHYDDEDAENLVLSMSNGETIKVNLRKLIDEWTVLPINAITTPIVLKKEKINPEHLPYGVSEWQDVLTADIRLHEGDGNILYKNDSGRTLYATVNLEYNEIENKLVFTWSENGQVNSKDIALNSVKLIEYIRYDAVKEEIVIGYKTAISSETIEVRIPVGDLITEWIPVSETHNVILNRTRNISGTDEVTADVRIASREIVPTNIIETIGENKAIFVRGEADNIKFGNTNVQAELERLDSEDERIEAKFDDKTAFLSGTCDTTNATIGSGFSPDAHETITYKFAEISGYTSGIEEDLQDEINRAKAAEEVLTEKVEFVSDAVDTTNAALADEISRSTTRDEQLKADIDFVSAATDTKLSGITCVSGITVDESNPTNPKIYLELDQNGDNILTLSREGLYTTVDLTYNESDNKLTFSTAKGSKDIELNSVKFIEYIRYDAATEEIVIGYKTAASGETIEVRIPVGDIITEWVPVSNGHNVILNRSRNVSGTDEVTADVRIASTEVLPSNILETVGSDKSLYVRGEADNIKFGNTNVKVELERLDSEDIRIESKFDDETAFLSGTCDTTNATIGTGFTSDPHANITAKFAEISGYTSGVEEDLQAEINRAEAAENFISGAVDTVSGAVTFVSGAVDTVDNKIGTGFTDDPHTNVTAQFEALSGYTSGVNNALSDEVERAIAAEDFISGAVDSVSGSVDFVSGVVTTINNTIGSGFTNDPHSNVTAQFEALSGYTSGLNNNLNGEIERAEAAENVLNDKVTFVSGTVDTTNTNLNNEISRSTTRDEELTRYIDSVSGLAQTKVSGITAGNSGILIDNTTPTNPKVNSNISQLPNNIVRLSEGIFASADLTYNETTNTLTFHTTNGSKDINLVSNSIVDRVYYDGSRESIIIEYRVNGQRMPDVVVPVHDLIREWDVHNHDGNTVTLTKTIASGSGVDLLSARVNVSTNPDNLLEVVDNEYLTVSRAPITAVENRVTALETHSGDTDAFIERVVEGVGLKYDGTYEPNPNTQYVSSATSVQDALTKLDSAVVAAVQPVDVGDGGLYIVTGSTLDIDFKDAAKYDAGDPNIPTDTNVKFTVVRYLHGGLIYKYILADVDDIDCGDYA